MTLYGNERWERKESGSLRRKRIKIRAHIIEWLEIGQKAVEQLFRRMVFNIIVGTMCAESFSERTGYEGNKGAVHGQIKLACERYVMSSVQRCKIACSAVHDHIVA